MSHRQLPSPTDLSARQYVRGVLLRDVLQENPSAAASSSVGHESSLQSVLAPASPDGHLLLSGRFNSEIMDYVRMVRAHLEARGVPTFMVQAQSGQSFAELTRLGLAHAKGMVAFCTSEYGAYTGVGYETFHELEFAHDHRLPLFPIRLCEVWPPAPIDNERGTWQNKLVFRNGLVYIDDQQMENAEGVADRIADSVERVGLF